MNDTISLKIYVNDRISLKIYVNDTISLKIYVNDRISLKIHVNDTISLKIYGEKNLNIYNLKHYIPSLCQVDQSRWHQILLARTEHWFEGQPK